MGRQLYRPSKNRVIAGVCGGFADYFNIDPAIIRILAVILAFTGTGLFIYILAWIVMPDETHIAGTNRSSWDSGQSTGYSSGYTNGSDSGFESSTSDKDSWDRPAAKYDSEKNKFIIGAALVGFGMLLLIKQLFPVGGSKVFLPMLLVLIGGVIIYKGRRK